eukprot:TRINITY_DN1044_c0_g1_i1.p1 TRINITY_DN1044_c0_g1~~TRINITY_DN1044_c0_g1_i1.p1  ORF type:complete len:239 (+),score=41.53 TRINITY_DN1044_c0_g1_i1:61-777(+)
MGQKQTKLSDADVSLSAEKYSENSNLTIEEVKALFKAAQKHAHDNKLSCSGLAHTLKQVAHEMKNSLFVHADHSATAKLIFVLFDVDHDDKIDIQELVSGVSILARGDEKEKQVLIFKVFDLDKNGYLTRSEVEKQLKKLMVLFSKLANSQMKELNSLPYEIRKNLKKTVSRTLKEKTSDEFLKITVDSLFGVDSNSDGKITLEEWLKGFSSPQLMALLSGDVQSASTYSGQAQCSVM